jgi:hypothetical protein
LSVILAAITSALSGKFFSFLFFYQWSCWKISWTMTGTFCWVVFAR